MSTFQTSPLSRASPYIPHVTTIPGLKTRVEQALAAVVPTGMVHDLAVDQHGVVAFTFVLTREHPASLARHARKAAQGVPGVTAVKVNVVEAAGGTGKGAGGAGGVGSTLD